MRVVRMPDNDAVQGHLEGIKVSARFATRACGAIPCTKVSSVSSSGRTIHSRGLGESTWPRSLTSQLILES